MRAVALHTVLALRRDPAVYLVIGLVVAVAILGRFLGGTTLVEGRESGLILAAASARLTLVVGLVTLVCTHLDRMRQGRELERLLTWPLSRGRLMVGLWLGWLVVLAPVLALALVCPPLGGAGLFGSALWAGTLALEGAVVIALALFAAVTLRRGVAQAAALGLYTFGRLSGLFLAMARHAAERTGRPWVEPLLDLLSLPLPRLDRFARSDWLLAGVGGGSPSWPLPDWGAVVGPAIQALGAVILVLGLAALDLRRVPGP